MTRSPTSPIPLILHLKKGSDYEEEFLMIEKSTALEVCSSLNLNLDDYQEDPDSDSEWDCVDSDDEDDKKGEIHSSFFNRFIFIIISYSVLYPGYQGSASKLLI